MSQYFRKSGGSPMKYSPEKSFAPSQSSFTQQQQPFQQQGQGYYPPAGSPIKSIPEDNNQLSHLQQQETELWRSRCQDLEGNLQRTNTDLQLANQQIKSNVSLEEKVEVIMRNNQQLMESYDVMKKQLSQKQSECEIWKSKYDKEINSKITQKSNSDMEIQRLQEELIRCEGLLNQTNIEKIQSGENQKSDLETNHHQKMSQLKSNHGQDISLYEEQLKKLREIVQDREKQISILNQKLETQKNGSQVEKIKLDEDKQQLQAQLSLLELENQRDKEMAQTRNDTQLQNSVENVKQHYQNEIDVLDGENQKLKELLELKTGEITSLITQNRNQKANNDEEQTMLRTEIEELKNKILEINRQKLDEIEKLKDTLEQQRTTDIQGLRFHHENQIDALEKEIEKLHEMIENKTQQIDDQIKEKLEQRQYYNQENERLGEVIGDLKQKQNQLEIEQATQKQDLEEQLNSQKLNYQVEQQKHMNQNQELESTIRNLQELLDHKSNDNEAIRDQNNMAQQGLKEEIEIMSEKLLDTEQKYQKVCHDAELAIEDLKLRLNVNENDFVEKQKQNEIALESKDQKIKTLSDMIESNETKNKNVLQNKEQIEGENQRLRQEIDQLQENINYVERSKNAEFQELRKKLEASHEYNLTSIKSTFDNQTNIMESEIQDLNVRLQLKEKDFQNYIEKYNKMEAVIKDFVNHPEKLKDKADVVTTQNLYDVLKNTTRSPIRRTYSPMKQSNYY